MNKLIVKNILRLNMYHGPGLSPHFLTKITHTHTRFMNCFPQENPIKYQQNYDSTDFNDVDGSLNELKELQLILADKFSKRSEELDDEDYNSKRIDRKFFFLSKCFYRFVDIPTVNASL